MKKRYARTAVIVSLLGTLFVGGGLCGCGNKDEEQPPPYKGQPGDKLPQASGTAGGGGAGAKQATPKGGASTSPD